MPAAVESPDAWKAASRKTAVSSPSRRTAKKAIATSAQAEPSASARGRRSPAASPARPRACRRIQTIMNVTMPTAIGATTVSSPSCCCCGSAWSSDLQADRRRRCRARPRAATPSHIAAQRVPAALLAQERGDDADDQRRLDALAQPDHERRQHSVPRGRSHHPGSLPRSCQATLTQFVRSTFAWLPRRPAPACYGLADGRDRIDPRDRRASPLARRRGTVLNGAVLNGTILER